MAKNIGDKAGEAIETTKLNSKISSEMNAIDGIYKKIGEYYYQQYKSGASMPEETAAFCAKIDEHNTAIDEAKAEIERIKTANSGVAAPAAGGTVCPSCGKASTPGTNFCRECGTKLEAAGEFCVECGTKKEPGTKFCRECGAKFE